MFCMNIESTHSRLESLLEASFEKNKKKIRVSGSSSATAFGFFLSQTNSKIINNLPHLVVTADKAQALRLQQTIEFFDPHRQSEILPAFDISPYSGLYPSPQIVHERLRFLSRACEAKPGQIFIAPCAALVQKTLPENIFVDSLTTLKNGDELPTQLSTLLQNLGYSSAPLVEDMGQFAIRGGVVDIFSPAESAAIRIELFGDQIQSLRTFSTQDQRSIGEVRSITICPAREVLFTDAEFESLIAKARDHVAGRPVDRAEAEELIRLLVQ